MNDSLQGCVLTASGVCTSIELYAQSVADNSTSVYVPSDSSSNRTSTTRPFNIFPAVNATYCETSDDSCAKCYAMAKSTTSASAVSSLSSVICVGASGCLCFASCEPSIWKKMQTDCEHVPITTTVTTPVPVGTTATITPSPSVAATVSTYSPSYDTAQLFITAVQAFGVFALIYVGIRGRISELLSLFMSSCVYRSVCSWCVLFAAM